MSRFSTKKLNKSLCLFMPQKIRKYTASRAIIRVYKYDCGLRSEKGIFLFLLRIRTPHAKFTLWDTLHDLGAMRFYEFSTSKGSCKKRRHLFSSDWKKRPQDCRYEYWRICINEDQPQFTWILRKLITSHLFVRKTVMLISFFFNKNARSLYLYRECAFFFLIF